MPVVVVDHDVLDERMDQSVPEHVGESDKSIGVSGHDKPVAST